MNGSRPVLTLFLFLACASLALAQGTRSDYDRAAALRQLTTGKVFKAAVTPNWITSGTFWYRNEIAGGRREFILVDAGRGQRRPAFDQARLAAALLKATGQPADPARLPLDTLDFAPDGRTALFRAQSKFWSCDLETYQLKETAAPRTTTPVTPALGARGARGARGGGAAFFGGRGGRGRGRLGASPDGTLTAFIRDNNVYVTSRETSQSVALSTDGTATDAYSGMLYWSPDSKHLVAVRTKAGQDHKVFSVESSPSDQLQPILHSFDYLKPGDRIPQPQPHLFDVAARREVPVKNDLFNTPWMEGVTELRWAPDSSSFTFLYNQRGHQVLRIVGVDAATGAARAIVDEQSKTFLYYLRDSEAGKLYTHYLDSTGEIIWMSERDGWNHLYLYDAKTGTVKNQITRGEWVVRRVESVDDARRQILFWASGIRPGQDPYYQHLCRVNFDGTGLTLLTEGDGTHTVQFSPDRRCFIDTYSRVDMPPVNELRAAADGKLLCALEKADASDLLVTGWTPPERFVAKGRDGKTDIYGVIWRPVHFDPSRKYPIIENIYAGPQDSFVPKAFASYYECQNLTELGFVVVQCDGMGTSNRSKAFHEVCFKNLGDAGFPDRILWIKAAAEKYPYLDLSRVGIYGTSAGGQDSLRAMLAHGDFYKAAMSDSGCHDNRMDKIWWNELWMGWPIGPHYAEQSNVTQAAKLQGKLLLIVGDMDTNVDPASTMQVANALIQANKDFDLLVIPGGVHGCGWRTPYGKRRTQDFFVRSLLGVEPRR